MSGTILTLNAGSSSLKFSVFELEGERLSLRLRGQISGLGATSPGSVRLKGESANGRRLFDRTPDPVPANAGEALGLLLPELEGLMAGKPVLAVGHRVVHGGVSLVEPCLVNETALAAMRALSPLAPLHQPHNIAGIEAATSAFPAAVQVACFDTAFHRNHPFVNDVFALPRAFYDEGVRRYGFHGLSYEYVSREVVRRFPELATGRVVIAHLGSGASMCAIRDGTSVGSTMGFSALDGLPMGTRCGQIDPGVLLYLISEKGYTAQSLSDLLYKQSGLKGLSGLSNDMRILEASHAPAAREALDYFIFRIRREIGAMAAILGGLDAMVFTGGIGENSPLMRAGVISGFEWLGMTLDGARNARFDTLISADDSAVKVLIMPTDEERMIAEHTLALLSV